MKLFKRVFAVETFNLAAIISYGTAIGTLLLLLPLSVFKPFPLHDIVSGIYLELRPAEVFWMTVATLSSVWSLMFVVGIVIDSSRGKSDPPDGTFPVFGGPIPDGAQAFLNTQVAFGQFWTFTALALPGLALMVAFATSEMGALGMASVGAFATYALMILISYPGRAVDADFRPLPGVFPSVVWKSLDRWAILGILASAGRGALTKVLRALGFRKGVFDEEGQLKSTHFFALTSAGLLALLHWVLSWRFQPDPTDAVPAGMYFYLTFTLSIWVLGALQFHFSRFRLSPLLVIVLAVTVGYSFFGEYHWFRATVALRREPNGLTVSPEQSARSSPSEENLVVVTCTGGGILAAGWLTLALKELAEDRPEIIEETRLLSVVSGSSTGAAFLLDGLLRHGIGPDSDSESRQAALQSIFEASVLTSLEASTYGFAFLDFWRIVTGGFLPFTNQDRGTLLELAWRRNAAAAAGGEFTDRSVNGLRQGILEGRIPAVIFNATVMEVGRRTMITPLDFAPQPSSNPTTRGVDLSEYYDPTRRDQVDLSIWTAARLSATVPYITPAARAEFEGSFTGAASRDLRNRRANHLIDGGYFDNFGIVSALDWLDPVLERILEGGLPFKRVLVIQLRAFRVVRPGRAPGANSAVAALIGPLIGIARTYSGSAVSRDEISLNRYIASWNARFSTKGIDATRIETAILERNDEAGPLSWYLTQSEIEDELLAYWSEQADASSVGYDLGVSSPAFESNASLAERRVWIRKYLSGEFDAEIDRSRSFDTR